MSTSATRARRAQGGAASPNRAIVYRMDAEAVRPVIERIFGRMLSATQMKAAVGARPGDHVEIVEFMDFTEGAMLRFHIIGARNSYTAARMITRDADGLTAYNQHLNVPETAQGQGLGTRLFAREVKALAALGGTRISTEAVGIGTGRPEMGHTKGYYVWPLLGYNAPLDHEDLRYYYARDHFPTHPQLPFEIAHAATIRDVFKLPAVIMPDGSTLNGREWWKRYGVGFEGTFDLTPGSESMQMLRTYLDAKRIDWKTV